MTRNLSIIFAAMAIGAIAWVLSNRGESPAYVSESELMAARHPEEVDDGLVALAQDQTERRERSVDLPESLRPLSERDGDWRSFLVDVGQEHGAALAEAQGRSLDAGTKTLVAWGLAYSGEPRAFELLHDEVIRDQENVWLDVASENALLANVKAMGFVASHDDRAYAFLKAGTDPEFWRQKQTWRSERGEDSTRLLVAYCIQGIGLSGREDGLEFLTELRARDRSFLQSHSGDIVQGVYYRDIRGSRGEPELRKLMHTDLREAMQDFMDWKARPRGRDWSVWASAQKQGRG